MSPLPERRKSAEEIARLREEMGIPSDGQHPFAPVPSLAPQPAPAVAPTEDFALPPSENLQPVPSPAAVAPMPDVVERQESLPSSSPQHEEVPASFSPFVKETFARPVVEQPVQLEALSASHIPSRKHTQDELKRLHFQNFVPSSVPMAHIQQQTAHGFVVSLGYLLALAGGVGGLLIAGLIAWKKPRSRHHAAIMLVIAVLVLVFGTLYYLKNIHAA